MGISRIAIITGVEAEAEAFSAEALPERRETPFGAASLGEVTGKQIHLLCSGIGKVNAAGAASWLAREIGAELLMVVGTAGRISGIDGDCFYLHEALQSDYGAQRGSGFVHYRAGSWPIGPNDWTPFHSMPQPSGLGLPQAMIATADAFIEHAGRSAYLRDELQADLVDMETGAIAQLADRLGLPWAAIKAATDDADGASAGDFEANLKAAAQRAAKAAVKFIELL